MMAMTSLEIIERLGPPPASCGPMQKHLASVLKTASGLSLESAASCMQTWANVAKERHIDGNAPLPVGMTVEHIVAARDFAEAAARSLRAEIPLSSLLAKLKTAANDDESPHSLCYSRRDLHGVLPRELWDEVDRLDADWGVPLSNALASSLIATILSHALRFSADYSIAEEHLSFLRDAVRHENQAVARQQDAARRLALDLGAVS